MADPFGKLARARADSSVIPVCECSNTRPREERRDCRSRRVARRGLADVDDAPAPHALPSFLDNNASNSCSVLSLRNGAENPMSSARWKEDGGSRTAAATVSSSPMLRKKCLELSARLYTLGGAAKELTRFQHSSGTEVKSVW